MRRALVSIAWREFLGGINRFRIFLACLGIGAFAIASSGSITESFRTGVNDQARTLLGGDVAFSAAQRLATPDQRAWIDRLGQVSETATLRLMAEAGSVRKQVEVRAADAAFPLVGAVGLSGGADALPQVLAQDGDRWGVAVSNSFLETFGVQVGDTALLGQIPIRIKARLDQEPDRIGEPGAISPSVLISIAAMREAGRLETGQLFRITYLVRTETPPNYEKLEQDAKQALGEDGLRLRQPKDAVDGLDELLRLLNSFFSVVGVASLVAGGVGISQATSAFLESRIGSIAALKAFGASASDIRLIYLLQLAALALLGVGIGVALGALAPFVLQQVAGDRIPLPQAPALYPTPLLLAVGLSLLTAAAFALPALGRARATPPAALFRRLEPQSLRFRGHPELAGAIAAGVGMMGLATLASPRPQMTALLLLGAVIAYGLLTGAALLIKRMARRAAASATGAQRLMLSNLGGPGSLAPLVAPALGLGLSVLTLVAVVQVNLLRQISETAPANAPSLVFMQIPGREAERFDSILKTKGVNVGVEEDYRRVPVLLGRITQLRGAPLVASEVAEGERWVVGREIQMTYLAAPPDSGSLTAGKWWPADYAGDPLVSVEQGVASGMNLRIGDQMGFRVFGREISAKVASIRRVDWGGFGVNMPFVFSPGALSGANPMNFAIARVPVELEKPIIDAIAPEFPEVVVFQTREALATAAKVVGDISIAVNAIASVVTLAGLLVLAGALATIARKRRMESALLKSVGATRGALLGLYAGEFAFAGAAATIIGVGLGILAAFPVVILVFEAKWAFPWGAIALIAALAIGASALGGGLVGRALMSERPWRILSTS